VVEVVDPKTLEVLPLGREGELVFTTITKEGFPLIRYRTGDISALIEEPCACGRTTRRMRRVTGRTDDLIFIKGQKVFPSQIEEILLEAEGTAPHYRIILDRQDGNDTMEVQVEISESFPAFDELKNLERLRDTITRKIEVVLGVHAKVTLVEPRSLMRESGAKVRRVVDNRSL
jgi:phenylacetate-CoA ligase